MAAGTFLENSSLMAGPVMAALRAEHARRGTQVSLFVSSLTLRRLTMDRSALIRLLRSVLVLFSALTISTLSVAAERDFAVDPQYDTSHVYVPAEDVNRFAASFLATFGGQSTKQVIVTVTPTPSRTSSQLLQTPVGTVSLFGFQTPIPYPFGAERTGYLVTDLDGALAAARRDGAAVLVTTFPDPIGRDAVIEWPGGLNMQLYWHTAKPHYAPFTTIPENRIYLSPDRVEAFLRDFTEFSHGVKTSDEREAPASEIGQSGTPHRRIRLRSRFGKLVIFVTNGQLPYPYGRETTGYEVANLDDTLRKAASTGARVLVQPFTVENRRSAMVEFPGGYIAEIHSVTGNAYAATTQEQ
jgi:hypothetical protein